MKRTTLNCLAALLVLSLLTAPLFAAPPRPSPSSTLTQTVGLSEVTIEYARPGVKERTIWGGLVPYDKVWRTGANEATTITFSHDAKVEGKSVPAGKYALFTIPGKDAWTVIVNRNADQWGSGDYSADEDVLRVEVKPEKTPSTERMEFRFLDMTDLSTEIQLQWAETSLSFTVEFDTHSIALDTAKADFKAEKFGSNAYYWAQYLTDNDLNPKLALKFAEIAVEDRERYWSVSLLARAAQNAGKTKKAQEWGAKAITMAADESDAAKGDAAELKKEMMSW